MKLLTIDFLLPVPTCLGGGGGGGVGEGRGLRPLAIAIPLLLQLLEKAAEDCLYRRGWPSSTVSILYPGQTVVVHEKASFA